MSSEWVTVYKSDLAKFRANPKRVGKNEVIICDNYVVVDQRLLQKLTKSLSVHVWTNSCGELIIGDNELHNYFKTQGYPYFGGVIIPSPPLPWDGSTTFLSHYKKGAYKGKIMKWTDTNDKYILVKTTLRSEVNQVLPDPKKKGEK